MKNPISKTFEFAAVGLFLATAPLSHAVLIGFNAEDGSSVSTSVTATVGSDLVLVPSATALGGQTVALINTARVPNNGTNPGAEKYTVGYDIAFPESGTFNLYIRFLKPASNSDDSMFYARVFGTPDAAGFSSDSPPIAWGTVNDLNIAPGTTGEYVWLNLSTWSSGGSETPSTLVVDTAEVKTFYIGAREDGLLIDAFAFGTVGETYTDSQLSASVVPEPSALGLVAFGALAMTTLRRRA